MTLYLVNHQVVGVGVFLVSTRWDIMCSTIHNPPSVKCTWVLLKSIANYASTAYGQNVMGEGTVRHWCRIFKDRRTNVHDDERGGRPATCTEWWCYSRCWQKKLHKKSFSQFQNFHVNFHKLKALIFYKFYGRRPVTGLQATKRMIK
jgi:hypothetical protein